MKSPPLGSSASAHLVWSCSLDSLAPPSELLEMCEQSLEKMGSVFHDSNVYTLHMMYQAMGVCIYMQDADGALSYGEKIIGPYRCGGPSTSEITYYKLQYSRGVVFSYIVFF